MRQPEPEQVVLVDDEDRDVGSEEKLAAHRSGALHRAFSVLLLDSAGRILLQRRALTKYHSAGLWSNACCGHPRPGEAVDAAARRRLREEMGIDCPLREVLTFRYRADVGSGLVENELDHVYVGEFDGAPAPDPAEVSEWRWVSLPELEASIAVAPAEYTAWLPLLLRELRARRLAPAPTR
ncbi:MAG TPA: isopentenyl-diphosphate Delta-isomerase [Gemmatimonadaceae bacterium]|nr:isopentenyl-diphosphate Delta-isomerase [Gemmatimonadaceae bacterium]